MNFHWQLFQSVISCSGLQLKLILGQLNACLSSNSGLKLIHTAFVLSAVQIDGLDWMVWTNQLSTDGIQVHILVS